jgi:8-oxo-dGTP diphosphatase
MNGDRVLLIKRQGSHGAGTWAPPGGYIDFGEDPKATASREVLEETGVTINEVEFRTITNDIFEAEQKHFITLWFDSKLASGEPEVKAADELSEVGWFTWDALPQPLFLPLQNLLDGKTLSPQVGGAWRDRQVGPG